MWGRECLWPLERTEVPRFSGVGGRYCLLLQKTLISSSAPSVGSSGVGFFGSSGVGFSMPVGFSIACSNIPLGFSIGSSSRVCSMLRRQRRPFIQFGRGYLPRFSRPASMLSLPPIAGIPGVAITHNRHKRGSRPDPADPSARLSTRELVTRASSRWASALTSS